MAADDLIFGEPLPGDEEILEKWDEYFACLGGSPEELPSKRASCERTESPYYLHLTPDTVDLEPLRSAIRQYKMMEIWGDSISELSIDERRVRSRSRALEAKETFVRLMISSSNNRTLGYHDWAVKTALGLRTSKMHTAQAVGGKHWRAWGRARDNDT